MKILGTIKMYTKKIVSVYLFLLLSAIVLSIGCDSKIELRFKNDSIIKSETLELSLSDTNKIFIHENSSLKLNLFEDMNRSRTDTLYYKKAESNRYEKIFGKIDQVIINTKSKNSIELYRFDSNKVFLAGYITKDSIEHYTLFSPPLIILTNPEIKFDSTISIMKTFSENNLIEKTGVNVKSTISLMRSGIINFQDKEEKFFLYELTISKDEIFNYGGQGLIIPDAVLLKSNLLYGEKSGLIAEWGIRSKQNNPEQSPNKQEIETFLEYNIYSFILN